MTGPTTQLLHCVRLRTNSVCKHQLDFGTPLDSQLMEAWRASSDVGRQNLSMVASPCWQQWDTSRPRLAVCVLITFYTKMFFLCVSIQYHEIFFIRSDYLFRLCTLSITHLCFYCWITHHFFFTSLEQIQGDHRQIPWILEPKCRPEVRRRPQRTSSHFQSASSGLGPNLGLHGLLRGFPRSVCWNSCCCRRLWLQGLDCV